MKIIAQVSGKTFLAEVTHEELVKLAGYNPGISNADQSYFSVGRAFNIEGIFEYVSGILKLRDSLERHAKNFRALADMVENMPVPTAETLDAEKVRESSMAQ